MSEDFPTFGMPTTIARTALPLIPFFLKPRQLVRKQLAYRARQLLYSRAGGAVGKGTAAARLARTPCASAR